MGRDQKLTLLINAYNALTLKLIIDHDLQPGSRVWLGGTLSGYLTANVGQVLQVGDKFDLEGAVAEVVEVDRNGETTTRLTLNDSNAL